MNAAVSSSCLRGLLFAVHTSLGGDQLVLQYPSPALPTIPSATSSSHSAPPLDSPNMAASSTVARDPMTGAARLMPSSLPAASRSRGVEDDPYALPPETLASLLLPQRQLCDKDFQLSLNRMVILGRPTLLLRREAPKMDQLTAFTLALALDAAGATAAVRTACHDMLRQLAAALKSEEIRAGYLRDEIALLLAVGDEGASREESLEPSSSSSSSPLHPPYNPSAASSHPTSGSRLARHMRTGNLSSLLCGVFDDLRRHGTSFPLFNNRIHLSLSIIPPRDTQELEPLRPYHSFLRHPTEMHLPEDASYQVSLLLQSAQPTKTFAELSSEVGLSLPNVLRIAAHLERWGFGAHLHALAWSNVYLVQPSPPPPIYHVEFAQTFGARWRLSEVLCLFGEPRSLSAVATEISAGQRRELLPIVLWLLKRGLLRQLHQYVHLLLSEVPHVPRSPPSLSPAWLDPDELAALDARDDGSPEFLLLRRLCPFFRGRHSVQEICWRESVPIETFHSILQLYAPFLLLCQHESSS